MARKSDTKNFSKTVQELEEKFIKIPHDLYYRGRYLSAVAKCVYMTLKKFENSITKEIFPRQELMQEESGLSKNSITNGLKELENFGLIETVKVKGKATRYKLKVPKNPLEKFEETIYPIPSKESANRWRKSQRSNKSKDGKTFAEKFEEKNQSVSKYKEQEVS